MNIFFQVFCSEVSLLTFLFKESKWWRWWDSVAARTARFGRRRLWQSTGLSFTTSSVRIHIIRTSKCAFDSFHISWWRWWDSNPWPPACRAGALPAELHPHNKCKVHNAECRIIRICFFSLCAFALVGPLDYFLLMHECSLRFRAGRTKWTRTTDLVLIRHAL